MYFTPEEFEIITRNCIHVHNGETWTMPCDNRNGSMFVYYCDRDTLVLYMFHGDDTDVIMFDRQS